MSTLQLRPYQHDAIAGIDALLVQGITRPAVVQATGLGKTTVFTHKLASHLAAHPRERGLVLVRRDELATQARDRIHQHAPHLRPGIVMGTQRDHDRQVVVASVQTLSRARTRDGITSWPRREQIHGVGITVYDECHHAAADTDMATLDYYGAFAGVPTIGFTATMSREDNRGLGEIWQKVVPRPDGGVWDTEWGIRNGFLCDVRGIRVQVPELDLTGVKVRAGDYQQEDTATRMLEANTGAAIVRFIHDILTPEYSKRRGVVFAPNVATAEQFAEEMNAAGIRTGVIIGSTPKPERTRIYQQFRDGELDWLTNAMVLTEGWDAPWCDALVIARPTKSAGLYQQMVGRGLRTFAGKQDCIVADVCGVTELHGMSSLTDLLLDRAVKPREGQSLLEALDEFEDTDDSLNWIEPARPVHNVIGTEIDMFGHSHSVWLQTNQGTYFVPAADALFFLWPQPDGRFTIGRTAKVRAEQAVPIQVDVDLDIGMALAEQAATEYAPDHAGKDAPWRQKGPIRPGQKREMEMWGLTPRKTMSAAQAYDALNIAMASVRLDVQ